MDNRLMKFCLLGMALGLVMPKAVGGESAGLELAGNGKTSYAIVHGMECTPSELYAAQELAGYLQQMTGAAFPVVGEAKAPVQRRIVVGSCNISRKLLDKKTVDALGGEEFIIRTKGHDLLLVGGRPRGTLYAVYHFLDNILGVRWWARDATFVPRKPELKIAALNVVQRPLFEMRGDIIFFSAWDQDWAAHNRINRLYYATWDHDAPAATTKVFSLDEKHGGGIDFPMPGQKNCHSFYAYLPVNKYFDAHPEWFAEINGKRTRDGQPCLSNPEVLAFITRQVLDDLQKNPKATMVSVTQYDGDGNYCRCANCRKIDEEEGSPSGSLIRFVNAVAGQVEKVRPDVLVETFAYTYSSTPPKITRPRANVVVRRCIFGGCNYFRSLDAPENAGLLKNIQEWNAISSHFYFWDYMMGYLRPYPNLRSLGPNLRILARNGVKGYLVEGSGMAAAEFDELRTWILSRLLWNPDQDDQALIAEFVNGYYGAAGRYVLDYINLIHDAAAKGNCQLYLGGETAPSPFVTFEVMRKAETLFQQAEQAVAGDADFLRRVRRTHMAVQYMWATNRDVWAEEAKRKGLPLPPPADEFFQALRRQALIEEAGTAKNVQRWMDIFLASAKQEMELAPLKLCTKASNSYASQPYMAFDGDVNTGVNLGGFGPQWIQKDLGKLSKVKSVWTMFGSGCTNVDYQIEGSLDEKTWFTLVPRKTINGEENVKVEDVLPKTIETRFVRTTIFFGGSVAHPQGEWVGMMEQKIEME